MLDRLLQTLDRIASWKTILGLFLAAAVMSLVFFPARARQLREMTGINSVFDTRFSYSPEVAARLIEDLGEAGRRLYATSELTLDLLFPIAYALFLSLLILALYRRGFPGSPAVRKLALLPFAVLVFDFLENFSVAFLLLRYPQQLPNLARAASLFTTLKWSLGAAVAVIVFVGLPAWLTGGRARRPEAGHR